MTGWAEFPESSYLISRSYQLTDSLNSTVSWFRFPVLQWIRLQCKSHREAVAADGKTWLKTRKWSRKVTRLLWKCGQKNKFGGGVGTRLIRWFYDLAESPLLISCYQSSLLLRPALFFLFSSRKLKKLKLKGAFRSWRAWIALLTRTSCSEID